MNPNSPERSIEQLMKLAGERELPSADAAERARAAAHESWRQMLSAPAPEQRAPAVSPGLRKAALGFALAATVATVAFLLTRPAAPQPAPVARIAAIEGAVALTTSVGDTRLAVADAVSTGSSLATGAGRVALSFGGAVSLRVDRDTRLRIDAPDRVTLLAGAVYVDSGGVNSLPALRIDTPGGEVRHIGTQFLVQVEGAATRVRVREGRVLFTPPDARTPRDVAAGDELRVADGHVRVVHGLPSFGPEWEWAASVAPPFDIESRPLAEFLSWIAREHGWQVRYASAALHQGTHEIRLHGSLGSGDAASMLERTAMITGVPLTARDGILMVGPVAQP